MKKPFVFFLGLFLFLAFIPPCSADEIKHTVIKGDTLWDISMKYLKTPWKWPLVWSNNQNITNPHLIYPGDVVVITREGERTMIKIIPSSPDRPTMKTGMFYTPEEVSAVKEKSIFVSPQYSTYIYSPNILTGSGTVIKKIEGGELASKNDHIVIKTTSGLEPGQGITIVSRIQDVKNGKETVGYLYRAVAIAIVQEVSPDVVKAIITYSLQEVKAGAVIFDDLAPIKPLMLTVSEPAMSAPAKVIDFFGGITGSSTSDLIFMDAGRIQGVEKGAILSIAQKTTLSDEKKKDQVAVFKEDIGLVLVLQALENTCMGLLVESKAQIEKGALVVGKK